MMQDLDKDYPARIFRHSVWGIYLAAAIAVVVLQQLLTATVVKLADLWVGLSEGIRLVVAIALLVILGVLAVRIVSRMRFDLPVLTISSGGISAPAIGPKTIPWTAISKISLGRTGDYGLNKWIILTPKDNLDPEMLARFSKSGDSQPGPSALHITLGFLEGTTSTDVLDAVKQYHAAFRGSQEQDISITKSSFHSSFWTGIEN